MKNEVTLPCVLQIGFAGARNLYGPKSVTEQQRACFDLQIEDYLVDVLRTFPSTLKAPANTFICGISQIAVGADTLFTKACSRARVLQCIFLPQPLDVYLSAEGSHGPDFSQHERDEAEKLLASKHIIHERIVSRARTRAERFQECNAEILRASDAVICLVYDNTDGKAGGTGELLASAKKRGRPTLEIRVAITPDQQLKIWSVRHDGAFLGGTLPKSISALTVSRDSDSLPTVAQFCSAVKDPSSKNAKRFSNLFSIAAVIIISTHIIATLCATIASIADVASKERVHFAGDELLVSRMLMAECALLIVGFATHLWIHKSPIKEKWALSRLLAEINRSVRSLGDLHIQLSYLFSLRLSAELRPLLKTLNILHLESTRSCALDNWSQLRDEYVHNRLEHPDPRKGQIKYYTNRCEAESKRLHFADSAFLFFSMLAIVATIAKVCVLLHVIKFDPSASAIWATVLEGAAILLPTLAVGAVSWAAAKEYNARVRSFHAVLTFLTSQTESLKNATSLSEFQRLVDETESMLLGETVEWYSRTQVLEAPLRMKV